MTKYALLIVLFLNYSLLSAQKSVKAAIVFELFTSQGCSSCPPADKLLEEIKINYTNQNVYVLSYHVDYWNRLGWKDPFSNVSYSNYQSEYAKQFKSQSVYTPQLVVNGNEHYTGSNQVKVKQSLAKYQKNSKSNTSINITDIKKTDTAVHFNYKVNGTNINNTLFAIVVSKRSTKIYRGENNNRTLDNHNIVANFRSSKQEAGAISISIPNWITANDELNLISYTKDNSLKVTGATSIML